MVGSRILGAPLATLASVNWVDLLIIGLMLLAAVHGLRLGALVQILAFVGFWVGFLLGTVVWVPALSSSIPPTSGLGSPWPRCFSPRVRWASSGGLPGPTATSPCVVTISGHIDSALGVGVAVVAVLLSSWLVASVISSPNSRYTWLSSAVARSDILHSVDRILPTVPPVFNDLQNYLNEQGFPQVFSTLTQPSPASVATPTDAATRALAESGDLLDGQNPRRGLRRRAGGLGFRGGPRVGRHQRPRGGRRAQHPGRCRRHRPTGRRSSCSTPIRSGHPAHERPSGPILDPRSRPGAPWHPGGDSGLSRERPADGWRCRHLEQITALGRDIYNQGAVHAGRLLPWTRTCALGIRAVRCSSPAGRSWVSSSPAPRSTPMWAMPWRRPECLAGYRLAESRQAPVSTQKCAAE